MKFKIEIEVEIFDDELLEMINNQREWDDLPLYGSFEELSKTDILEWVESRENYFNEEIIDYGFDINKVTIVKE